MKNPLKVLEPNIKGRDFVIGDLHGSFSVFKNLIENLNFNPESDRMISVGDLVDRGPDSLNCLRLLRKSWFYAALSNHEQMMYQRFFGGHMGHYWYDNGGDWGMEAVNDYEAVYVNHTRSIPSDESYDVIQLQSLVEELPFLITVKMEDGRKFHIVHAEFPFFRNKVITDEMLSDPATVYKLAKTQGGDGDSFLWARYLFGNFYKSPMEDRNRILRVLTRYHKVYEYFNDDLSHIISGHTIVRNPLTIVGQTNIDTGAYHSYWKSVEPYSMSGYAPEPWAGLTCVDLKAWKFFKATATTFQEVEPTVVTKEELINFKE